MPAMLFNLRSVPDDEAQDIRELLKTANIDYYETPAGRWGISSPAFWVNDESELDRAKEILSDYQISRSHAARKEWQDKKNNGEIEPIINRIKNRPVEHILLLVLIMIVVYLFINPFWL